MKTRNIIRFILTICLCAVILVSCDVGESGDTGDDASSALTYDPSDVTDGKTETSDVPAPTPEYEKVTSGSIIYYVYADHAVAVGADIEGQYWNNKCYMNDTVNDVPVTEILDGAFDGILPLRIYCDATYDIYDTARAYAVEHEHIFIETNSDKLPNHYYPDWVIKLDWQLRDMSEDKYVFEDDNARISELVNAYLLGDKSAYDELLRRTMFRYACAIDHSWWYGSPLRLKYVYTSSVSYEDREKTDYDRYDYFLTEGGSRYQFACGYLDTYEEVYDYLHLFFTKEAADKYCNETSNLHNLEGYAFFDYTGYSFEYYDRNPVYTLHIESDKLILSEKLEVWDRTDDEEYFTGEYTTNELVFEKHDGKWQLNGGGGYTCVWTEYDKLYGN